MVSMLGSSASGLLHCQNVMDVVGNNLANVNLSLIHISEPTRPY